jgi:hypothetical protein
MENLLLVQRKDWNAFFVVTRLVFYVHILINWIFLLIFFKGNYDKKGIWFFLLRLANAVARLWGGTGHFVWEQHARGHA